jgi:ribosomal protein S18 acetylase RimI-like enzyme
MIRRAKEKDITTINKLLSEVLEIHHKIRPDIFISGTTKYTNEELKDIISNDATPIFVYVDDSDNVLGYAFCVIKSSNSINMHKYKTLFIDDLCVDSNKRGMNIGSSLISYVKDFAKKINCHDVTLNVWEGNDNAKEFYKRMGFFVKEYQMEIIID